MTPLEMILALIALGYEVTAHAGGVAVGKNNDADYYVTWVRIGRLAGGLNGHRTAGDAAADFLAMEARFRAEYDAGGSMSPGR